MTLTWIPFFIAVQFFSRSTCTSAKTECRDSSLQYVFYLVSPSSKLLDLTKFLNTIDTAKFLETSNDKGIAKVICDSQDWEKIYRYTNDRGIYILHSSYCSEKNKFSTIQQLHFRKNEFRKLAINEALYNFLDREKKSFGKSDIEGVKNNRILKTREVHSILNKTGVRSKHQNHTLPSSNKNSSRRTNSKNTGKKNQLSLKKSNRQTTTKIPDKTISRKSSNTKTQTTRSSIGKSLRKIKRYSLDILRKNHNGNDEIITREERRRRAALPEKKATSSKPLQENKTFDTGSSTLFSTESDDVGNGTVLPKKNNETESFLGDYEKLNNPTKSNFPSESSGNYTEGTLLSKDEDADREPREKSGSKITKKGKYPKHYKHPKLHKGSINSNKSGNSSNDEKDDCETEKSRDHRPIDKNTTCLVVDTDIFSELTNHLHKIFDWVKSLEISGKKG